jgi:hypothetical protein
LRRWWQGTGKRGRTSIALSYWKMQHVSESMETKQLTTYWTTAHCSKHKEKY